MPFYCKHKGIKEGQDTLCDISGVFLHPSLQYISCLVPHTHFRASSLINMHMLVYTDAHTAHTLYCTTISYFSSLPLLLSKQGFSKRRPVLRAGHSIRSARLALDTKSLIVLPQWTAISLRWSCNSSNLSTAQMAELKILQSWIQFRLCHVTTTEANPHLKPYNTLADFFIFVWNVVNNKLSIFFFFLIFKEIFSHDVVYLHIGLWA